MIVLAIIIAIASMPMTWIIISAVTVAALIERTRK